MLKKGLANKPYYPFWDPRSGLKGGLLMGLFAFLILVLIVKVLR